MAFALNGADEPGQARFDLIMSIARDERHASRLPTGIEQVKHAQQRIGLQAGTTFHAYGIANTAQIFDMGRPFETGAVADRSEEQTSELQSLMRISYAVFC